MRQPRFFPLLAVLTLTLAACGGPRPVADGTGETSQDYVVRGEVRQLPDPAKPARQFLIRHEAIHDFVAADGSREGMDSMTMPFFVADPQLLHDLQVGDKVEFDLHVDWSSDNITQVKAVRKLPPETVLTFGRASPTEQAQP